MQFHHLWSCTGMWDMDAMIHLWNVCVDEMGNLWHIYLHWLVLHYCIHYDSFRSVDKLIGFTSGLKILLVRYYWALAQKLHRNVLLTLPPPAGQIKLKWIVILEHRLLKELKLWFFYPRQLLPIEYSTQCGRERDVYVLDKRLHPRTFHLYGALIPFILTVHLRHCQTKMINTETFWPNVTHALFPSVFVFSLSLSVCRHTVWMMGSLIGSLSFHYSE